MPAWCQPVETSSQDIRLELLQTHCVRTPKNASMLWWLVWYDPFKLFWVPTQRMTECMLLAPVHRHGECSFGNGSVEAQYYRATYCKLKCKCMLLEGVLLLVNSWHIVWTHCIAWRARLYMSCSPYHHAKLMLMRDVNQNDIAREPLEGQPSYSYLKAREMHWSVMGLPPSMDI